MKLMIYAYDLLVRTITQVILLIDNSDEDLNLLVDTDENKLFYSSNLE